MCSCGSSSPDLLRCQSALRKWLRTWRKDTAKLKNSKNERGRKLTWKWCLPLSRRKPFQTVVCFSYVYIYICVYICVQCMHVYIYTHTSSHIPLSGWFIRMWASWNHIAFVEEKASWMRHIFQRMLVVSESQRQFHTVQFPLCSLQRLTRNAREQSFCRWCYPFHVDHGPCDLTGSDKPHWRMWRAIGSPLRFWMVKCIFASLRLPIVSYKTKS